MRTTTSTTRTRLSTQTTAKLQVEPDLGGIFGVNVFSAQGAGNAVVNAGLGGVVDVIAFDATQRAMELMDEGVVSLVIAQKPFDMGYMGVAFCMADAAGVTSLPPRVDDRLRGHRRGQRETIPRSPGSSIRSTERPSNALGASIAPSRSLALRPRLIDGVQR